MTEQFPLRFGSAESFRIVSGYLNESGYSESFLQDHFRLPSIHHLLYPVGKQGKFFHDRYQALGKTVFLARLLFGGYTESRDEFTKYMRDSVFDAFLELGILEPVERGFRSSVLLFPIMGLLITSDRTFRPDGKAYTGSDLVMSGTESMCRTFLESFSKRPCGSVLEVGTGSGVGALLASRFAKSVVATDIVPRSVEYVRFNCLLNGVTNVEVRQGDLFAPVQGMRFDRIICNPPLEPSLKWNYVFSVGGEDGEAIIERLVREVADYLNPGGRVFCQVMGTDRDGETFDARARRWLGANVSACDLALFSQTAMDPMEYATQQVLGENCDSWKMQEWALLFHKLKARKVVVGFLVIQRHAESRPSFHVRHDAGPKTSIAEIEWLLDWETQARRNDFTNLIYASKPEHGSDWELCVRHDSMMTALDYTFYAKHPFDTAMQCPPWLAVLVGAAYGKDTGAELASLMERKLKVPREEFLKAITALVGCGVLRIEGHRPPEPVKSS